MIDPVRKVKLILLAQNLTPNSFAHHCHLSPAWVSYFLAGKRRMSEPAARKIAANYGGSWKEYMED